MIADREGTEALERGRRARREQRVADARAAFAEAAGRFRRVGAQADLATALACQAQIERDEHSFDAALAFQIEALVIERQLGDRRRTAHAVRHVGDILGAAGRHHDAEPYVSEMMSLYRSLPDTPPLDLANAVRSAAVHKQHLGNVAEARDLWREARERYAALDDQFRSLTGSNENPGVAEADRRLAALGV